MKKRDWHCLIVCAAAVAGITFFAATVLAQAPDAPEDPPAGEPAAPAAPKAGAPDSYLVLPAIPWMRDDFRDPDRNKDKELRDRRGDIKKTIESIKRDERGELIKDERNARTFDVFFTQHIFAQMTQPERATEFANDRKVFFTNHMWQIKSAEVHDRLVKDLALPIMLDIAKKNYHPAARYNAMLIIGDLNQTEAVRGGSNPAAPEPYLPALAAMLNEFKNPDQIDVVRVACLVGILRHAEMDGQKQDLELRWNPNAKLRVIEPLLALLNAKDPPAGRSAEGHVWMQRRALDILAAIGDPGTDGAVVKKMESIVADENAPMTLRCTAAVSLGRIGSLAAAKYDALNAVKNLGFLALDAAQTELARLEAEKKRREELLKPFAEEGGSGMRGSYPGGMRQPGMPGGGMRPPGTGPGGMRPPGVGPSPAPAMPSSPGRPASAGARTQARSGGPGTTPPGMGPGGYPSGGTGRPGMPSMPGMPGMGGMSGASNYAEELAFREKYKVDAACRRLRYALSCVKTGLKGTPTRPAAGIEPQFQRDPYKSQIAALTDKIDALYKVLDKTDAELDALIKDLKKGIAELDTVVRAAPSGDKPAAPGEEPAADGPDADGPPGRGPAKAPAAPEDDGPAG